MGQCERRGVGQHVARVGQQGQRARQHASDGLHDHEAEDQEKDSRTLRLLALVTVGECGRDHGRDRDHGHVRGLGHGASGNWVFDCGSKYNT